MIIACDRERNEQRLFSPWEDCYRPSVSSRRALLAALSLPIFFSLSAPSMVLIERYWLCPCEILYEAWNICLMRHYGGDNIKMLSWRRRQPRQYRDVRHLHVSLLMRRRYDYFRPRALAMKTSYLREYGLNEAIVCQPSRKYFMNGGAEMR